AYNKIDKLEELPIVMDFTADRIVNISAKKGIGFEELSEAIAEQVNKCRQYIEKLIPYSEAGLTSKIRANGVLLEEDYREDGIYIRAYVDKSFNV
ncbi:MAG: GTPase HflX, partial [Lachnospiraceae bacterium]|nr:GTPase HflX [Lachnospiraceae bacterium]